MPQNGSLTSDEVIYIIRNRIGLTDKSGIYIIKRNDKLILGSSGLPDEQRRAAEDLLAALAEGYDIVQPDGLVAAE